VPEVQVLLSWDGRGVERHVTAQDSYFTDARSPRSSADSG
jgi:hypothetical protein